MFRRRHPAQNTPHPRVADPPHQRRRWAVGLKEPEGPARVRIVPALLDRETFHVLGKEAVGRIVAGNLSDAGLVGVTGDVAVGNSNRRPHGALAAGPRADNLQNPCFLGVGDRDRFARTAIAVFVRQLGHHLDSLACRAGALQAELHHQGVTQKPVGIDRFRPTPEGSFGEGKLMLVHQIPQRFVGVRNLGDFSARFAVLAPRTDLNHLARLVVGGGNDRQLGVCPGSVAMVGDHHRPVGRRPASHQYARTSGGRKVDRGRHRTGQ